MASIASRPTSTSWWICADPVVRERWRRDAGMVCLSFWDPENRRPTVDLFADYPMDFEMLLSHSIQMPLTQVGVRVAALDDLMMPPPDATPPPGTGTWADAEALRRWSFQRRTPQQRLDWLVDALTVMYSIRESKSARGSAPPEAARNTDE